MFSSKSLQDSTSTPKRRRLGTSRILSQKNHDNISCINTCSPIDFKSSYSVTRTSDNITTERCESPHLPCNQVEYSESNNISSSSDIPCSPGIIDSSVFSGLGNWELGSLAVPNKTNKLCNKNLSKMGAIEEIDEISDEMFLSKLEQSSHVNNKSKVVNEFKESVENSFNVINQSIYQLPQSNKCKSFLFESKDSFLLDVKESGIVVEDNELRTKGFTKPQSIIESGDKNEGFYGLPIITKKLFKTYRNIEKFYDWQEECLNLDAIKERRNLIYALPTSGGKTLVAEVLMLREVVVRKKNALFILPFVAIVQEKIWSLSPFALELDFLVEEYAAGKGHMPPKKRRKKNSIYIATIEKGLALVRTLIELERLHEIGLIVVDELHLIGEKGRGATLETLLTTVLFTNLDIQIVGMSATIGNLPQLACFLRAEVFSRHFRPVPLTEFAKVGDSLYGLHGDRDPVPCGTFINDYDAAAARLDPDRVAALVWRARGGCLVFCPTQRNCENVAALLCTLQPPELCESRVAERVSLAGALRAEGASAALCRAARCGVGFHHAGLAPDERALLEHAFRSGVVSVLCCTSTLAAGVNLPAARVVVRAPRVGRDFIALAAYRQMVGRAGRAGVSDAGESIIICSPSEWPQFRAVLQGGVAAARSVLVLGGALEGLLLSAVALKLASTRAQLRKLLGCTLLAVTNTELDGSPLDINTVCDATLQSLLRSGALEVLGPTSRDRESGSMPDGEDCSLGVSTLGRVAIKGCMELSTARQLVRDLDTAARSLVLLGGLHLLYLVTPHDAAGIRPDYRHYYTLYCNLDDEGIQTAKILGITESNAIRMMIGKPITNVPERVICRFYVALMLHDLWKQMPLADVAEKYGVSRGLAQSALTSASGLAWAAARGCEELAPRWPLRALLAELAPRLQHCASPDLQHLMELPAVRKARALQLVRAGYKRVEDVARAAPEQLAANIPHLSRNAAHHLVSSARMMLIEKVENLRAEAEDVMDELNV